MTAAGHGATVVRFRHDDPEHLEDLVRASEPGIPRIIAMDGLNSMTGNAPDLAPFARIAREHEALLYVDDAHGFGVIGERSEAERCDYGARGNSVIRHQGLDYDHTIIVGGFSKAYSSLLSFIGLPTRLKEALKVLAPPYLYSGPSPVASLATTIAGLDVNEARGEDVREQLWRNTDRLLRGLRELRIHTPNRSGFPLMDCPTTSRYRLRARNASTSSDTPASTSGNGRSRSPPRSERSTIRRNSTSRRLISARSTPCP